ncbi:MAG TPA: CoA pyrophosphatase [Streptosporangiaceae bacterium]|nr:CoA pyrophosphatase [Streptosporangiaceae bacterium]
MTTDPPVPGWLRELAARFAQVPVPPVLRPPPGRGRRSAVLVLFGHGAPGSGGAPGPGGAAGAGDPDLLLIQRRPGLRRHGGQPAFPGGAIDPADAGPVDAALREAAEEVGLDPAGVDVVGTAPELYIDRSEFRVVPVIGWWRRPVAVRAADPDEVAAVARVPIGEFADPANRLIIRHPSGHSGPAFRVGGMLVWGFTAALVSMLLTLGGWETPWDTGRIEDLPPEALAAASVKAQADGGNHDGHGW